MNSKKVIVTGGAGCSGFVRKPIDIDELPKQVAEHIARASSTDWFITVVGISYEEGGRYEDIDSRR